MRAVLVLFAVSAVACGRGDGQRTADEGESPGADSIGFCGQRLAKDTTKVYCLRDSARDLTPLGQLPKLQRVSLENTRVRSIAPLRGLADLRELWLLFANGGPEGDVDLAQLPQPSKLRLLHVKRAALANPSALSQLPTLEILSLSDTNLDSVAHLAQLPRLRILYVGRSKVRDVTALAGLASLEKLDVTGLSVPEEQLQLLRRANPKLNIAR